MKRIGLLLILLLLFLVACDSSGVDVIEQAGSEEPEVGATMPPITSESTGESAGIPGTATDAVPPTGIEPVDPKTARDRDWKLGDTVDPAVTVIEYGDFQ